VTAAGESTRGRFVAPAGIRRLRAVRPDDFRCVARDPAMPVAARCDRRSFAVPAILGLLTLLVVLTAVPGWQAARAQEPGETEAAPEAPKAPPNLFTHIVKSAGPVFGPLLLLMSLGLVALIVILAMDLRMATSIPPDFVEEFTDTVNKRKFKEAFDLARNDNSFLGRVLTAGMGRLQYGIEDAREVVFNTVEATRASKDQLITYLATIGTLGPMIGLVGTVVGMIMSFMVLSRGGSPNAADLANGISHALVLTLLGVALSVPAIFCHALFRNRLNRIAMDAATIADDLLTQMYHNSRRPAPAATTANASAPTAPAAKPAT
jgi:biopolymer transport protein ExbB